MARNGKIINMRPISRKPVIIGVTGSFGTGKSTVAAIFGRLGAKVLNADKIAHRLIQKGTGAHKKIVKKFGKRVLDDSGTIDRARLADNVFRSRKKLDALCAIIHPEVIKDIKKSVKNMQRHPSVPAVVIDAPLLIEAGMQKMVDSLVVVRTSGVTQIKRAKKNTGLSVVEIKRRIKNQMPLKEKVKIADYIIDNEGSRNTTERIVKKIWREIKSGRKY